MGENVALREFKALRSDVEQFDDHPFIDNDGSELFSNRVPLYMKSYLVNWLRRFLAEHGDEVERQLEVTAHDEQPFIVVQKMDGTVEIVETKP